MAWRDVLNDVSHLIPEVILGLTARRRVVSLLDRLGDRFGVRLCFALGIRLFHTTFITLLVLFYLGRFLSQLGVQELDTLHLLPECFVFGSQIFLCLLFGPGIISDFLEGRGLSKESFPLVG